MSIKPILFNSDMVRAILDGRKTQTRRVVRPQPQGRICFIWGGSNAGEWAYPGDTTHEFWGEEYRVPEGLSSEERNRHWSPPCHGDDILWVRETWSMLFERAIYKAGCSEDTMNRILWRPSIHMPREAARIFLRVTDVGVERLKNISPEDAVAEGAVKHPDYTKRHDLVIHSRYRQEFAVLWDATIKPAGRDKYGWDANPWVWVIKFERCEKPEG